MARNVKGMIVEDVSGWILVSKDEDSKNWHIAWLEPFSRKKQAIAFAVENRWPQPYRAVRGRISAD